MRIPARFNGPADSGHGGYTAGLLARELGVDGPVTVSLRAPIPLDADLELRRTPEGLELADGDTLIAAAAPGDAPAAPPAPVTPEAAAAAEQGSHHLSGDTHPYPTCYGCGPQREDGLRLFAGPLGDGRWAARWVPQGDAVRGGAVDDVFVWAALDCPSAEPIADPPGGRPVVLAGFTVVCERPVPAGEPAAVVTSALSHDGRKRRSTVGLFDAAGERLAHAEAFWIALR